MATVLLLAGCEISETLPTGLDAAPKLAALELPPQLLEANPDLIGQEYRLADALDQAQARRLSLSAQPSAAGAIQVPGDYDTIQEAVDNASPGDVIQVRGKHSGTLQIFIFTEGITLDGGGGAKIEGDILWVLAPDVTITGFHMAGMRIWTNADNTEISYNHSQGLDKRRSIIATLRNSSGAMIHDNKVDNAGDGVFLFGQDHTVVDNVLTTLARSGVFFAEDATGNRVSGCQIARATRGLLFSGAHDNHIENLVVRGSKTCDIIDEGTNNTFVNATFKTMNC